MFNYVFLNETNLYYIFQLCDIENCIIYNDNYQVKKNDIIVFSFWNYYNGKLAKYIELGEVDTNQLFFLQKIISKFPNNKIIFDSLAEELGQSLLHNADNVLCLYGSYTEQKNKNYILFPYFWWFYEYIWDIKEKINYNEKDKNLLKNRIFTKKFFMPMRNGWYHRQILLKEMREYYNEIIYSAVWLGINLPNDSSIGLNTKDRFLNEDWYNQTYFSIVSESWHTPINSILISEKSYKPIRNCHPFMILSGKNHLKFLKFFGFETFDNLFDESYDLTNSLHQKIKIIKKNIQNYNFNSQYDSLTIQKLKHNYYHFNDQKFILNKIQSELLDPIQDFINSQ